MKNEHEKIPAVVFDWIEQFSFAELDAKQQNKVLEFFTAENYDELHEAAKNIRTAHRPAIAANKERYKQQLLEKFDQRHQPKTVPIWQKPVALWKVAAAILLVCSTWAYVFSLDKKETDKKEFVASIDTVYVTKEVPAEPVKIHDTVYIERKSQKHKTTSLPTPPNEMPVTNSFVLPGINGTGVLPVDKLDQISNRPRGNSMKDDTLLKKYSFVTL